MLSMEKILKKFASLFFLKDCEIKEEGKKHFLTLYNVRLDQAGGVDFQAANAKSGAHLRVKRKCLWNYLNENKVEKSLYYTQPRAIISRTATQILITQAVFSLS